MHSRIDIITNAVNLVELKSEHHKAQAELNRKTGEWGVWLDGRLVCTRVVRDAAIDTAMTLLHNQEK